MRYAVDGSQIGMKLITVSEQHFFKFFTSEGKFENFVN